MTQHTQLALWRLEKQLAEATRQLELQQKLLQDHSRKVDHLKREVALRRVMEPR